MNAQCSIIRDFTLYEFKLGHIAAEATKNVCWAKGESEVNHSILIKSFKKFCLGSKNLDDQVGLKS